MSVSLDRAAVSGGGAAARRVPPDVPPHIQQLLDQQERQALERGSPMRRPLCRRILTSGGGTEIIDSPGSVYMIPGLCMCVHVCFCSTLFLVIICVYKWEFLRILCFFSL